jgi:arabinogalactan endo-1,4-beta-galactosidase
MTRRFAAIATVLAISVSILGLSAAPSHAVVVKMSNGADVSWLPEIEQAGSKFFDAKGHRIDALKLMKQSGLSVARVRLWVNPPTSHSSLAEVLALAKRIKAAGLDLTLDIHYSDWWADPAHQTTPQAWQGLNQAQLVTKVGQYTTSVLAALAKQKTSPKWVQIGNEIANGLLWPSGQLSNYSKAEFAKVADLLNAAAKAVRSSAGRPKVMIHLETGGDAAKTSAWLTGALVNGLTPPDAVGVSYYSQWGGPLANLQNTLTLLSQSFEYPVAIAETAYPNTTTASTSQVLDWAAAQLPGLEISLKGQASYAAKACSLLKTIARDKAIGVWWWEGFSPNTTKLDADFGPSAISSSSLVNGAGRGNAAMLALGKCK